MAANRIQLILSVRLINFPFQNKILLGVWLKSEMKNEKVKSWENVSSSVHTIELKGKIIAIASSHYFGLVT